MINLQMTVHDLEQYSRGDNLEIVGVPYNKDKNTMAILEKLAEVLEVKFYRNDISTAHRLSANNQRANPSMLVKFVVRYCKYVWMTALRVHRNRLTAAALK